MDSDFQHLYEKYGPMVYRRCLAVLGDEARANDAMHDVFVNVMQNKTRVDWRGPGSDQVLGTNDDLIVGVAVSKKLKTDRQIVTTRYDIFDPGADGLWFTEDDESSEFYERESIKLLTE